MLIGCCLMLAIRLCAPFASPGMAEKPPMATQPPVYTTEIYEDVGRVWQLRHHFCDFFSRTFLALYAPHALDDVPHVVA